MASFARAFCATWGRFPRPAGTAKEDRARHTTWRSGTWIRSTTRCCWIEVGGGVGCGCTNRCSMRPAVAPSPCACAPRIGSPEKNSRSA
eukprot:scaffold1128_cov348-Pavlova_lutheri.AAC.2